MENMGQGFHPIKRFVKSSTLGGVCIHRVTLENLCGLAASQGGSAVTLLCGHAFALNPKLEA
eukprot:4649658-Heterocapsa_arctica.AAC.1